MGSKEKTILQSVVLWYNNCAKSAVRTDETVRPASRELYQPIHGVESKCRFAALSFPRTRYIISADSKRYGTENKIV